MAELGLPASLQNDRSALALLALLNLPEKGNWKKIERPMLGIRQIKDWINNNYQRTYQENTRESFRDETIMVMVNGGLMLRNPDDPERPTTSSKNCYQIEPAAFDLLSLFGTKKWKAALKAYLSNRQTLIERYARAREMVLVPIQLPDGLVLSFTPGAHNLLIKDIIEEFVPRFAPGAIPVYIGDTGNKDAYINKELMKSFGVSTAGGAQIPDVVLYDEIRDWLFLIESVTSNGPIDDKRFDELSEIFKAKKGSLIFVTAFPNRTIMRKFLASLAWDTEIWIADAPTHMIHFNGDRFMGPREAIN